MAEQQPGRLKMSILNTDDALSPLKFRGWLRGEAEDIQAGAVEHDLIIIRLFMPEKLRFLLTQKKLDNILQGITDKLPNIYRIELIRVQKSLDHQEMVEAAELAKSDLNEIAKELSEDKRSSNLH
jgi:hypothetical protein